MYIEKGIRQIGTLSPNSNPSQPMIDTYFAETQSDLDDLAKNYPNPVLRQERFEEIVSRHNEKLATLERLSQPVQPPGETDEL